MTVKNNMTAQEKLVLLMQAKQDLLVHEAKFKEGDYFGDDDASEIAMWPDKAAEEAWDTISRMAKKDYLSNFGSGSCPWCTKFCMDCERCGYAKRHGKCGSEESTWLKIPGSGHKLATTKFYKELVDMLESLRP